MIKMQENKFKKILIVGDAGRGKSTLAETLSKKTGIKNYSTDDFYWEVKFTKRTNKIESRKNIELIYKKDGWIVDGTTHDLWISGLDTSDIIIHLKFSNIFAQYLAILRRSLKRNNERFSDIVELLRHVTYKRFGIGYKKGVPTTADLLKSHQDKVVALASYKDINKFITTFY
jgi:adenylate kinase family enzyme